MGCTPSSNHKPRVQGNGPTMVPRPRDENNIFVDSEEAYDKHAITNLQLELKEDMEMFIVNNILMSVMFFDNYEREIRRVANNVSKKEQEMSFKLMKDHNKQCLMPDILFENVNQMVKFSRKHGPKKNKEEPLISQRMYIIHDTVEVLKETEDLDHYSGIDKPTLRVNMLYSHNSGFVKLKQVECINPALRDCTSLNSTNSGGSSTYAKGKQILKSPAQPLYASEYDSQPSTSDFEHFDENSSSDEYDFINDARTQRPLSIINRNRNNSVGIPQSCIKPVKIKNLNHTDDNENDLNNELYVTHKYIGSLEFMVYFRQVFPGPLGESLGFLIEDIQEATFTNSGIYCDTNDEYGNTVKCEILPAILNPWPDLNQWIRRSRPVIIDNRTTKRYVWPSENMTKEICKLHSVVIPRGFLDKRGESLESDLEWEIAFPKAEKFMLTRMSHAQMRCFLFMTVLFKTYIEPMTEKRGLLTEHLRILMLWECEKNFKTWPENRMGSKLIMVLRNLYNCLGKQVLPDYFIENKNVLGNIPGKYLRYAQEKIHNIIETPVTHFICALRNVKFTSKEFYPALNFEELYNILFTAESMKLINPTLYKVYEADVEQIKHKKKLHPEQRWQKTKIEQTRLQLQMKEKNQEKPTTDNKRTSTDSINLKWSCHKNVDFKKVGILLKFFIKHFIKIADKSLKFSAAKQALFYLKQAWYLAKVLEDYNEVDAMECLAEIREKQDNLHQRKSNLETIPISPNIPMRNSSQTPKDVLMKNNRTLDITNVNQSFQKGIQANGPTSAVQKNHKPPNLKITSNWVESNNDVSPNNLRRNTKVMKWNDVVEYSERL